MFRSLFDRLRTSPGWILAIALAAVIVVYALPFSFDYRTGGLLLLLVTALALGATGLVIVKIAKVARAYYDGARKEPDPLADSITIFALYHFAGLVLVAAALILGGVAGG